MFDKNIHRAVILKVKIFNKIKTTFACYFVLPLRRSDVFSLLTQRLKALTAIYTFLYLNKERHTIDSDFNYTEKIGRQQKKLQLV